MVFELKDKNQNVIEICDAVPVAREVELRSFLNDTDDCDLSSNKLLSTETGYKNPVKVEEDEYSFVYYDGKGIYQK